MKRVTVTWSSVSVLKVALWHAQPPEQRSRLAKSGRFLAVARLEAQCDAISRLRRHHRMVEAQSGLAPGAWASQVTFLHPLALQRLTFKIRSGETRTAGSSPSAHCVDVSAWAPIVGA